MDFASAASASAVCSFCRSTLLRDGDALKRIGVQAELFDDHSPLQLQASGRHQGAAFTLVGRLQYRYDGGSWNEWHALFDNGRSGWLSEDNGRYVLAFDAPAPADAPALADLSAGTRLAVGGSAWSVASVTPATLHAAQGELPGAPRPAGQAFTVADLRNERGEVATLDFGSTPPGWSVGRSVRLVDLGLSGLRDDSEKTLTGRSLNCPSCGASVEVKLASTQSVVCGQCDAVVQVAPDTGAALSHYRQENGLPPQIPLGATGRLLLGDAAQGAEMLPWQVVGYVERCEVPDDPGDERVFWREYLLYHPREGFAFLVDAEDGWSWTAPLTGVPQVRGDTATWQGRPHRKLYSYTGQVTHVLGEFYWKVERGQRTFNTDYAGGDWRLNREQAGEDLTWSAGRTLSAQTVVQAFGLKPEQAPALARDSTPFTSGSASGLKTVVVIGLVMLLVVVLMSRCGSDDCDGVRQTFGPNSSEYQQCQRNQRSSGGFRTGGGSFGGFSSGGGGHK